MGQRSQSLATVVAGGSPSPATVGVSSILDRIWVHVAAYALLLVAITAIIPLDASFGGDDGAYGGQVHALERGSWALERPVAVVPTENEGWLNTAITDEGPLPYTSNPAYALLLAAMPGDGSLGLQLVPLFGALGSAAAAWVVARALRPTATDAGAATLAFWSVALGPVLVNSTTLWAHTASTAVGGLSVVALLQLVAATRSPVPPADGWWRRAAAPAVLLAGALLAASLLRTEAVFWIVAIAATAAIGVTAGITRVAVATATVVGLGSWFMNRSWGLALRADRLPIDTAVVAPEDTAAWLASRVPAAWRLLLTSLGGGLGALIALAALSLSIAAAARIRRSRGQAGSAADAPTTTSNVPTALLFASAGTYLLHSALAPGETISGTVAAWPIVPVLLIVGWPRHSIRRTFGRAGRLTDVGLVLLPAILFTAAVLLTQYSLSGGHQWGGRYLSMAFVPLGAAAAVLGWPILRSPQHRAGLLAVLVAPALVGTIASGQLHNKHQNIVADTTAIPAEVVVTEVIALPRIAWTALPTAYYVADGESVEELLGRLATSGVESVNVHGLGETPLDGTAGYRVTEERGSIRHLQLETGS
ncbi:MAG: hypothetical protein ACR2QO_10965 [Acidimicrobiales bacterium]